MHQRGRWRRARGGGCGDQDAIRGLEGQWQLHIIGRLYRLDCVAAGYGNQWWPERSAAVEMYISCAPGERMCRGANGRCADGGRTGCTARHSAAERYGRSASRSREDVVFRHRRSMPPVMTQMILLCHTWGPRYESLAWDILVRAKRSSCSQCTGVDLITSGIFHCRIFDMLTGPVVLFELPPNVYIDCSGQANDGQYDAVPRDPCQGQSVPERTDWKRAECSL